jgi:aminopeptidase N
MSFSRSARLGALATAAASFLVIAASSAPTPGADGIGDSYFPQLGNGGFDARHYALDVAYNPDTDRLDGRTTLTARATQSLSSFDLDLQKLEVTRVEVNGRRADFTRDGDEIHITPRA